MAKESAVTAKNKEEISQFYRQMMVTKIEEALQTTSKTWPTGSGSELENKLFVKSKDAADYMTWVVYLVEYLNDSAPKHQN